MNIPDLKPDFIFSKLGKLTSDIEFAFEVKSAALGPHIISRWGWDENYQRIVHQQRFSEKPFYEIRRGRERLGTLSMERKQDHIRFGEFYLFPAFHRQGIGSRVLAHCLVFADEIKLPVRLEYLHWNPVGALYHRFGFVEISRNDIHCFMERPAPTI